MKTATEPKTTFKPYLVEGGHKGKNIFRVMEESYDLTQAMITLLLERLPVHFSVHIKDDVERGTFTDEINEPLEVYPTPQLINIYPGKDRVVTNISQSSPQENPLIRNIWVDNLVDIIVLGKGQLRSCIHFDPKNLGIIFWPLVPEVEVDMFVYPRGEEQKERIEPLIFGKHEVASLFDQIGSGYNNQDGHELTVNDLQKFRKLIMYAVTTMRSTYENPDVAEDYPVRVYYQKDWVKIFKASTDAKLVDALNDLREGIRFE